MVGKCIGINRSSQTFSSDSPGTAKGAKNTQYTTIVKCQLIEISKAYGKITDLSLRADLSYAQVTITNEEVVICIDIHSRI
ncbi:hypothetical protein D3C71_2046010 [compost metagenome]